MEKQNEKDTILLTGGLKAFADQLSADTPAPGGGAAAAASGLISASLALMAVTITVRKEKELDESRKTALYNYADEFRKYRERFMHLTEEDTASFYKVMNAFRMTKATRDEKVVRKTAIRKALRDATDIPVMTASEGLELLKKETDMLPLLRESVLSDGGVAISEAQSAITGALMNVFINIKDEEDINFKRSVMHRVQSIQSEQQNYYSKAIKFFRMKELL